MTFQVSTRDGILYLTLDTPNSSVNIFTHEAARQVLELMSGPDLNKIRAVVFGSAKPGSFINGTRLLFAQAANTPADVVKSSEILRNAFLAVRRAPVPTIAVIRGNCWGCGVEFLLNFRYRIAVDTHDTHFYMTELNDYLLLPIFGAPYNLPHTTGLKETVDFLLRGERWSAKTAAGNNLINEVAAGSADVPDFIERVIAGKVESCMERRRDFTWGKDEEDIVSKTRAWIYRLPPVYQRVYSDCLDLVVQAAKQTTIPEYIKRHSLIMAAENICAELTRSAFSFFYIRQTASILVRDPNPPAGYRLSFPVQGHGIAGLFKGRILDGVTIDDRGGDSSTDENIAAISFMPYREKGTDPGGGPGNMTSGAQREKHNIMVELTLNPGPIVNLVSRHTSNDGKQSARRATKSFDQTFSKVWPPAGPPEATHQSIVKETVEMILYNPFPFSQSYFFEAAVEKNNTVHFRQAISYLLKAGFQVAVTRPGAGKTFGLNHLWAAYLYPLAAYILRGGKAETVNFTLREFGYVRRPHDLIANLDKNTLAHMMRPYFPGSPRQSEIIEALDLLEEPGFAGAEYNGEIIDAQCIALLAAVYGNLQERCFPHPAAVDLAAREVLDFPLRHRSLCGFLTKARVKTLLENRQSLARYLNRRDLEQAVHFLEKGRNFYL